MRIISEPEFAERIREALQVNEYGPCGWVTGPGRSGAIAAVYASHILHIPFIPYGDMPSIALGSPLIIDTARSTGKTMRKAMRRYESRLPSECILYEEPTRTDRVAFWYEAPKPQRYRHERPIK